MGRFSFGAVAVCLAISVSQPAVGAQLGETFQPVISTKSKNTGTYRAPNGMRVAGDPANPSRFDILQLAGNGGSDYWCAAGEYVVRRLGLSGTTRIYLVQPLGRGRLDRNSIGYSVNPSADVVNASSGNGATMSMKKVGQNWSAAHARGQCPSESRRNR